MACSKFFFHGVPTAHRPFEDLKDVQQPPCKQLTCQHADFRGGTNQNAPLKSRSYRVSRGIWE